MVDNIIVQITPEPANNIEIAETRGPVGPQGPAGSNTVPTDAAIASAITTPGTDTNDAINSKVGAQTTVPAGIPTSLALNGSGNNFLNNGFINSRGYSPINSIAEGDRSNVFEYASHGEGSTVKADGKISHAEGNACICTANDSHAEGNRTVTGRRQYRDITQGSEDAGDGLGVLEYALIPDVPYGDVTSYFPNRFTDNITTRYGAGASKDSIGNIYGNTSAASGVNTPAVWADPVTISLANNAALSDTAPDPIPVTANSLKWAMHSICVLRGGPSETAISYARIAKATYTAGVGTKVYYFGHYPGSVLTGYSIYSSYSPVVLGGGNGQHSEGYQTSTWNYGAHAEGLFTCAWGNAAHVEGRENFALNSYTHVEGYQNTAYGIAGRATGQQAVSRRDNETAHSSGKRLVNGDNQRIQIMYGKSHNSINGWGTVPLLKDLSDGLYKFKSSVIGLQTGGAGGVTGAGFGYEFSGLVKVTTNTGVTSMEVLGTISRVLVGRSASLSGDGLSTGVRLTVQNALYTSGGVKDLIVRLDQDADTIVYTSIDTVVQYLV